MQRGEEIDSDELDGLLSEAETLSAGHSLSGTEVRLYVAVDPGTLQELEQRAAADGTDLIAAADALRAGDDPSRLPASASPSDNAGPSGGTDLASTGRVDAGRSHALSRRSPDKPRCSGAGELGRAEHRDQRGAPSVLLAKARGVFAERFELALGVRGGLGALEDPDGARVHAIGS